MILAQMIISREVTDPLPAENTHCRGSHLDACNVSVR